MTDDILGRCEGSAGFLSLNRPSALHALTLPMCHEMRSALSEWAADAGVEAVIIDHAEGRGFCAGGDITFLRNSALNDGGTSEPGGVLSALAVTPPPARIEANAVQIAAIANKEMVNAAFETGLDQGILIERRIFQVLTTTEDKAEGMAAFIEKRPGVWKGT